MADLIPPVQDTMRADIGRELERMSSTISLQLADIITNARWFTTLVLAEIAGIVKFTETSHGWRFALVVGALLVLAVAAATLIFAIYRAQSVKNSIVTEITKLAMLLPTEDFTAAGPGYIKEFLADLQKILVVTDSQADPVLYSNVGLGVFLVGTILAGFALFVQ